MILLMTVNRISRKMTETEFVVRRVKVHEKILRSKDDLIFNIVNYTLLGLALVIYLYPLIYIVSSSFSSVDAVVKESLAFSSGFFSGWL